MQLTANRLCRVFVLASHRYELKVDKADAGSQFDYDADVCIGKEIICHYHMNARNGCLFLYSGDNTLFKTIPSGRRSEALDAIIRHYKLSAPTEWQGHEPRRF